MKPGHEVLAAAAAAMLAFPTDFPREELIPARKAHHEFSRQVLARSADIIPEDHKPQVLLAVLQASLRVAELAQEGRISPEYVDFLWTQAGEDLETLQGLVAQVPGLTASLCKCESQHPIIARDDFQEEDPLEAVRAAVESLFGRRVVFVSMGS